MAVAWFHHHSATEVVGGGGGPLSGGVLINGGRGGGGAGMVAVVVATPQSFLISQRTFCFLCRCDRILQFLHITTTNSQIYIEKY